MESAASKNTLSDFMLIGIQLLQPVTDTDEELTNSQLVSRKNSTFDNDRSGISSVSAQILKKSGKTNESSVLESDTSILAIRQQIRDIKNQNKNFR